MEQQFLKTTTGANLNLFKVASKSTPRGIIQITHGMVEHGGRYQRFAEICASEGFAVFIHDLRGHGNTRAEDAPLGRFSPSDGLKLVLEDQNAVVDHIAKEFPNVPIIAFGHSLGAIIALNYLFLYPHKLQAIACWNKPESGLLARLSTLLLRTESLFKDPALTSFFAWKLSYGAWNNKFKPNRTVADWISQDEVEVDRYVADPFCGFDVSISMWLDVLEAASNSSDYERLKKIPKDFPLHLRSGENDPCTNFGRDHRNFEKKLIRLGLKNLDSTILANTRHESLNEWNRKDTINDFISWLKKKF